MNFTGLTIDLQLTPYEEEDGVRWQIDEELSISSKSVAIKFENSFI